MHSFKLQIEDGPFDLNRVAKSGQMFRWLWESNHWLVCDGENWLRISTDWSIESNTPESSATRLFRLESSHELLLHQILQRGPEMGPYLEALSGLRMMRPASKVETLFSFLCSANNHVKRIESMVWSLAAYGELPYQFPNLERLSEVTEHELRSNGFGYRAATIPKVAQHLVACGAEKYLDELALASYEDARRELLTLPGVGPKLADCICLFALDHQESVPIDTHIWQQLTHLYHPEWEGASLTHAKYDFAAKAFRDKFGELAGAAHQFLFVENMQNWRDKARAKSEVLKQDRQN